jgi:magnesium chelatase family protein
MLARRTAALLPPLTDEEALEVTTVHSVAGLLSEGSGLVTARPFRAPHHTISAAGLTGGGSVPRPGEVSLAHKGVLFLDELPEFRRDALEALRQPVEEGVVSITRALGSVCFPSEFALVASMNACPCGNLGHPARVCTCSPSVLRRYLSRVSGPLLDRMDVRITLAPPAYEELSRARSSDGTSSARTRVVEARRRQAERGFMLNARLTVAKLECVLRATPEATGIVRSAVSKLGLSARGYHKVLRVSRTIADLAGDESVRAEHVLEALQYREEPSTLMRAGR